MDGVHIPLLVQLRFGMGLVDDLVVGNLGSSLSGVRLVLNREGVGVWMDAFGAKLEGRLGRPVCV